MVALTGVASCFFANAVSYVVVFGALASIDRRRLVPRPVGARTSGNLRVALAYVRRRPDVRRPLVVMAVVGLVVLNFQTTFPSMVRFGFDRGAGAVGTAMSVSAIGSILGGIYAAGKLQKQGVIEYSRGRITVLDRARLEELSCECYAVVKKETDRLLPYVPTRPAAPSGGQRHKE